MSLTRFDATNDIVILESPAPIVTSTWSTNDNNLDTNFTSSVQFATKSSSTGSVQFYIDAWNAVSTSTAAQVQYSLAYGHRQGSGSPDFTNDTGSFGNSASRVTYNQYRQLVFQDETQYFTFGTHTPESIYVINVNRANYKQRLSAGTLDLIISGANIVHGAKSDIKITDDSVSRGATSNNPNYVGTNLGGYYNVVSGSNGIMSGSTINQHGGSSSYGHFYPHAGLIILNGDMFKAKAAHATGGRTLSQDLPQNNPGLSTNTDLNHIGMYSCISSSNHFIIDTEEDVNSQFYFVRARNSEFNYTNNPSFTSGSTKGTLMFSSMRMNPKVFITTVGLYNNFNELIAVAKLSQPIAKDFTKEALIRVKLDF
tara:strand:+ start:634 stop:1740 length:1107 start_codon:yes stop_codon:yes gene_type:complete